jgi:myo-inositol-1(or 4)-monophosphatase
VRWVVDPLDGTVNYLYGLPDWSVSIAAEVGGKILAGVVEVPRRGERFTAVAGHGAWLHRDGTAVALRCNPGVPLGQALVGTGFGYDPARRRVQGEVVAALLPFVRDIRRGGSAAVDLCSVAAGRRARGRRGGRRPVRPAGEHLHDRSRRPRPVPGSD